LPSTIPTPQADVLQDPKSLAGQRLLHLSSINTGSYPTNLLLLPRPTPSSLSSQPDPETSGQPQHQLLLSSTTGSLTVLAPLSSKSYRSLSALQSYLLNTLPSAAGLNPRAYRAVDADVAVGGRAVLDGSILVRGWGELGSWKRAEGCARADVDGVAELRAWLGELVAVLE
jgi:cleavage and polyadenylation specificity factor subunit 1